MRGLALILALLAGSAAADSLPALYDVTGVAAGDVLNIRAEGKAEAAVVGTLPPDATAVEVVEESGNWGLVNTGEGSGWVNLRFMARQPGPDWFALETPLRCLGTEPFWSLGIEPATGVAVYSTPEGGDRFTTVTARWPGTPYSASAAIALPEGFAVLTGGYCSDGMSDRAFGIRADLFLTGDPAARMAGCCTLAP